MVLASNLLRRPLSRAVWRDRSWLRPFVRIAVASATWLLLSCFLFWLTLSEGDRAVFLAYLASRFLLMLLIFGLGLLALALAVHRAYTQHVGELGRLLERARANLAASSVNPSERFATVSTQALAEVLDALASQRDALRADMVAQVAQASQRVQEEKNRLEALMAELPQAVLVCNAEGLILLYNRHAVTLLQTMAASPDDGQALLGLGRSVYGVFEPELLAHGLDHIRRRQASGVHQATAQFVSLSPAGVLLRVQVSPVRDNADDGLIQHGFVLVIDDVSSGFEQAQEQAHDVYVLSQAAQGAMASLSQALQALRMGSSGLRSDSPVAALQTTLQQAEERVHTGLDQLVARANQGLKTLWPLQDMLAEDLMAMVQLRIQARQGCQVHIDVREPSVWLRVDSFSLTQALDYLAQRLHGDLGVQAITLRVQRADAQVYLDLVWPSQALSAESVMTWQIDPMPCGDQASALTVRDVLERHRAELGFERDHVHNMLSLRWVMPGVKKREASGPVLPDAVRWGQDRPAFYDFDLFQTNPQTQALEDRALCELVYTVFDTETTGLNPSQGDCIIQIGAVRCVNGRLLRGEYFDRLVNPARAIPAQSTAIHGITQDMVAEQPFITQVLPSFHRFAKDSVLVAHNAAFDMKFLQLHARDTNLVFDHPVLDTLLLSSMVHPHQTSHRLEAIAERFGITVLGRHTALGDALVTAEIWMRLIALLQAMGVHTLGQARHLAHQSNYARLKY